MKQLITNVSIQFYGTAKGKRKVSFQSIRLEQLLEHVKLDESQVEAFKPKVMSYIETFKNVSKVQLCVNHGENDDGMTMIKLLPEQRINLF